MEWPNFNPVSVFSGAFVLDNYNQVKQFPISQYYSPRLLSLIPGFCPDHLNPQIHSSEFLFCCRYHEIFTEISRNNTHGGFQDDKVTEDRNTSPSTEDWRLIPA